MGYKSLGISVSKLKNTMSNIIRRNIETNIMKGITPESKIPTLKEEELNDILKSKKHQIFTQKDLQAFRADIYKAIQENPKDKEKYLKSAHDQFEGLERKKVIFNSGEIGDVFLKSLDFEKEKYTLKKGDNMNMEEEDDDDSNLSMEELAMLKAISKALSSDDDGTIDEDEMDGISDDDSAQVIESLVAKGLIEVDEQGGVTGITDKGMSFINNSSEEEEEEEEGAPNMEGEEDENEEDGEGMGEEDPNLQDTNEEGEEEGVDPNENPDMDNEDPDMDNENPTKDPNSENMDDGDDDDSMDSNEDPNTNPDPNENGGQPQYSEEEVQQMASEASDEALKAFIAQSDDEALVSVAKMELQKRGGDDLDGDGNDDEGQGDDLETNNPGQKGMGEEVDPQEQEEEEFKSWMDDYLDEHDEEDLQDLIKDLLKSFPGKRKELKSHYRNNFPQKNAGNKVSGKIDKEDFATYLDDYLGNMTAPDLKRYAKDMMVQSPDSLKSMKMKFKSLKEFKVIK